ncbi:replicative DNA helicase [Thermaerobacter subterraneus]|uniref:Replicative DNA helicase n=1 Tax=Thermaerobacter subterraneus DSM 13965 TaxID=867903 RepID=K6QDK9_9FIRM|nr:replicative DNA helicase [Thermaerobacter subterraneus]EKP94791.1 replicative DNA helicase [Thermaerobacter subterraneus DSM 13965]
MSTLPPPDRVPPQNVEAEQSVLGAILIDREALARVLEILEPSHFYREAHQRIFEVATELFERGEAVDTITLSEALRQRGWLERVGGLTYLTSLANAVPTAANAEHYARIVEEKALLRRLVAAATDIARRAYEGQDPAEEQLDAAEQAIFAIAQDRRRQGYAAIRDVLVDTFEHIERLYLHQGETIGVPTGFRDLDSMLAGLHPSELIILAARPSQGKTTLALNMVAHAAAHGYPVGVFSLEMSRDQLAMRLLAAEARLNQQRLRTGMLAEDDWPRLTDAIGRLSELPVFIDDTPNLSIMEVRARARRMKAEHDIGLLVLDYLQLMHTRGRAESRQQEISEISRSLKALARELKVPVLALSQLSRAVEQRQDRRPQLSDLRESGAIEQDADVVLFIYHNPEDAAENVVEIIVAKQRNGPTGSVKLYFLKEFGRFGNLDTTRYAAG